MSGFKDVFGGGGGGDGFAGRPKKGGAEVDDNNLVEGTNKRNLLEKCARFQKWVE